MWFLCISLYNVNWRHGSNRRLVGEVWRVIRERESLEYRQRGSETSANTHTLALRKWNVKRHARRAVQVAIDTHPSLFPSLSPSLSLLSFLMFLFSAKRLSAVIIGLLFIFISSFLFFRFYWQFCYFIIVLFLSLLCCCLLPFLSLFFHVFSIHFIPFLPLLSDPFFFSFSPYRLISLCMYVCIYLSFCLST